jgi:hypothetical protein
MTIRTPLNAEASVVLDASGNGTVTLGPNRMGQSWVPPLSLAVSTSTAAKVASAQAFLGSQPLGGTYTATNDSTDLPGLTVLLGQQIKVVFAGGDVGAVAKASVTGTVQVG